MSGEQELRAAVRLVQTGVLTPEAARAMDYFSQRGVQCEARRTTDGAMGIAYRSRRYTPEAFNALIAGRYSTLQQASASGSDDATDDNGAADDNGDDGDEAAQSEREHADASARDQAMREAREHGLLTYADIETACEQRQRAEEGAGAAVWAIAALAIVGAAFAAFALWAMAQGFLSR